MLSRLILSAAALVLLVSSGARAGYIEGREEAAVLMQRRAFEPALEAFRRLAITAELDVQKADALEQAARCALALAQPDLARELAGQIPIREHADAAVLHILFETGQEAELLERFAEAPIAAWPAMVRGQAFYDRGRAALKFNRAALAIADLTEAAKYIDSHNEAPRLAALLGDAWLLQGETAEAIAAYRTAYPTREHPTNVNKAMHAAISVCDILIRQGRYDLALAELVKIEDGPGGDRLHPIWQVYGCWAKARVREAEGKTDAAISLYRRALDIEGITDRQIERTQKHLDKLLKSG